MEDNGGKKARTWRTRIEGPRSPLYRDTAGRARWGAAWPRLCSENSRFSIQPKPACR